MPEYVTCEQCAEFRGAISDADHERDLEITKLDTEVAIFKKLMYSILGVLISGFVGVIFAVLSI